jgi:aspartate-semialdehyde dehydrogenase
MSRIPVGILGATGTVGQRFIQLLADHPWFRVTALAASERSTGLQYAKACRWLLPTPIPDAVRDLVIQPLDSELDCHLVFSALPTAVAGPVEERFAEVGYLVCTNAAPHRLGADVPLLVPEVNPDHTQLLEVQRRMRGWPGLIVASANCTTTQLVLALKPLHDAFVIRKLTVVTLQAISGAGYPGVPAADILGNVVPFIKGEEEKVERESSKLLGTLEGDRVLEAPFAISAQCNRVPVYDGHTECVSIEFEHTPDVSDVMISLETFGGPPEIQGLPSSPTQPIIVHKEADRPQPLRDRHAGDGMSVSVGRVRPCPVFDVKFVILGHNTLRGAAGGAIHNAELLVAQNWVEKTTSSLGA